MKKLLLISALFLLALTSCIDVTTKVKLNTNGSGTIEETVMISKDIIAMLEGFMAFDSTDSEVQKTEMFSEDELKNEASSFGEGVKYISSEKHETQTMKGYTAVYSFNDINKVKVENDPGEKVPSNFDSQDDVEKEDVITFNFTKEKPLSLKIFIPKSEKSEDENDEVGFVETEENEMETDTTGMAQQMQMMFKNMKVSVSLEINGKIVETDAAFVDGNKITLFEMDFEKLLSDPEKLEQLEKTKPDNFEQALELMKDIPGFKIEFKEVVNVIFN